MGKRWVVYSLIHNKLTIEARENALPTIPEVRLWRNASHHPNAQIQNR